MCCYIIGYNNMDAERTNPERNLILAVLMPERAYVFACILPRYWFLRAFRRIAPIGASNRRRVLNRRRVILSRDDDLIPKRQSYPA